MLLGIVILIFFGFENLCWKPSIPRGIACFFSAILIIPDLVTLKSGERARWRCGFSLAGYVILSLALILTSSSKNEGLGWVNLLPVIAFYTQGVRRGGFIVGVFGAFLLGAWIVPLILPVASTPGITVDEFLRYIIVSIMTAIYQGTQQKRQHLIRTRLIYDELTGARRRRVLIEDIRKTRQPCLLLVNIDDFKEVNSLYGSEFGDQVIKRLYRTLVKLLQDRRLSISMIYRLHADEFAVLSGDQGDHQKVVDLAHSIAPALASPFFIRDVEVAVSASVGLSSSPGSVLGKADMALKTAKASHEAVVEYHESMNMGRVYENNLFQVRRLRKAIAEDRVVPYFQPIVDVVSGDIVKYECLARILDRDKAILPSEFLDLSKRSKLYHGVSAAMIEKSFAYFAHKPTGFSINLCLDDILHRETLELLDRWLDGYPRPERVVFELLETQRIEDSREALNFVRRMKQRGCRIALDDFGTGYTNFNVLLKFEVDYIKIDGTLVTQLMDNQQARLLTRTITEFAERAGILTIAEYVYGPSVLELARELGVNFGQGFYLGKPLPDDVFSMLN